MRNISFKLFKICTSVQEMPLKIFFDLQVWLQSCSGEQNHFGNFGRGHYIHEEYFGQIIFDLDRSLRRCRLRIFLTYSSGGHHLVWQSRTIKAILTGAFL